MAEIDKDMWQRQEDTNTIINYLCGSEEQRNEYNKRLESWNWFQKFILGIGTRLDDLYTMGFLDSGYNYDTKKYKNNHYRIWVETKVKLHKEYEAQGKNFEETCDTWYGTFIFYIKWFFRKSFNWLHPDWANNNSE